MTRQNKIKVLIVDDSPVARELMKHIVISDPELEVVGEASNGLEAINFLERHHADVITMDIIMPVMDGYEATRRIMSKHPVPILMVSAHYDPNDAEKAFKALEAGALSILEKPAGILESHNYKKTADIVKTIKLLADIKLITRRFSKTHAKGKEDHHPSENIRALAIEAVAIGGSLGGPQALKEIFTRLPLKFPVPIFVVQHTIPGFTQGLADWLQIGTKLKVSLAKSIEKAVGGNIYLAPHNVHLEVGKGGYMSLVSTPPEEGIRPSINHLFHSMAQTYGSKAIGVILTGMGRDGAEGLLKMKEKGAFTIGQNEETCVMYGMPKEAAAFGAVSREMPLDEIPIALNRLVMG